MFLIFSDFSSQIRKNTVWFRGVESERPKSRAFCVWWCIQKDIVGLKVTLTSYKPDLDTGSGNKTSAVCAKLKKKKKCRQLNANAKTLHSFIWFHSSSLVKICPCLWKRYIWTAVKWLFRPQLKLKVDGWVSLCLPHLKFIVLKQRQNTVSQRS